ncbi:MAG: hypothetical protein L3K02_00865 [Thermoplasmata archaeon]|nr:hypothetical protein [Thermoplasmata archaeon]
MAGSWWGHPAGRQIYLVGELIDLDPDTVVVKLWRGKLTLLHRRLWPALVRIGRARSTWQTTGLDDRSTWAWEHVEREGAVRADQPPPDFPAGAAEFRGAIRDLDQRLLLRAHSVHTKSGAHALEAQSWTSWSDLVGVPRFSGSAQSAQLLIERAADRLTPGADSRSDFPWGPSRSTVRSSRPSNSHRAVRIGRER